MGSYYRVGVTIWKGLWTYLATLGVVGATDVVAIGIPDDSSALLAQWPVLLVSLAPAVWRVIENIRKNYRPDGRPMWEWPWTRLVAVLCVAAFLGGCAGFGGTGIFRPGIGDHSMTKIEFDEETAAGDKTKISFIANGEAAATAGVQYTGETGGDITKPWSLSVQGDSKVTSPQSLAIAQGYAVLLEKTPETISDLAKQIAVVAGIGETTEAAATGVTSIKQKIIELLIARFFGGSP